MPGEGRDPGGIGHAGGRGERGKRQNGGDERAPRHGTGGQGR